MRLVILAAVLLAVPATADYKDWREGHSGDYAFFDDPEPLSTFQGQLTLEGMFGNDRPTPRTGTEADWVAVDYQGDGAPSLVTAPNERGTDIGNVWIAEDDGNTIDIYMRLFDDPLWVTPQGTEVLYTVNFTHEPTSVIYRVDAKQVNGVMNVTMHVRTSPIGGVPAYCEMPHPITGGFVPQPGFGGYFTWEVEYADMDVATTPTPPDDDACQPYITYGAPAQAGDVLTQWRGRVFNSGGNIMTHAVADESDGQVPWWQDYPLGPVSVPAGPFTGELYVMGQLYTTVTTSGPCAPWCPFSITLDDEINEIETVGCRYQFDIVFGQARDTLYLRGAHCLDAYGTDQVVDNIPDDPPAPEDEHPPFDSDKPTAQEEPRRSTSDADLDGIAGDNCEGFPGGDGPNSDPTKDDLGDDCDPDLDGDGVPNSRDTCPTMSGVSQADTDLDGIGDACNDLIDEDGDEYSDLLDNCPAVPNGRDQDDQRDRDRDGIGDACDDDIDGDGVPNDLDACPLDPRGAIDTDGDGICDHEDRDDDGDGFDDFVERIAGSDPLRTDSRPDGLSAQAAPQSEPTTVASMGLVSLGFMAGLVLVGVALVFLLRPRQ